MEDFEPELRRVAKLIFEGKMKPGQIDAGMVRKIAKQMMQGFAKGYGKDINSADLSREERTFLTRIETNLVKFAGFKNNAELSEAHLLILDNEGGYKDFNSFFSDLQKIDETYNEIYAQVEYDSTIASAQNAASYQSYVRNGIRVLTFQTAGDDNVRSEHAVYDGLTLSIDDPMLNTLYTPLDWGCRCEWVPGEEEEITTVEDWVTVQKEKGAIKPNEDSLPKGPAVFRNNVGKTGKVFPDSHPYFKVDKETAASINEQLKDINKEAE